MLCLTSPHLAGRLLPGTPLTVIAYGDVKRGVTGMEPNFARGVPILTEEVCATLDSSVS